MSMWEISGSGFNVLEAFPYFSIAGKLAAVPGNPGVQVFFFQQREINDKKFMHLNFVINPLFALTNSYFKNKKPLKPWVRIVFGFFISQNLL